MKKVNPGDPLRITAKAWNEFVDAAEFVKSLRHGLASPGGRALTDRDVVLVKNASGGDLARFGVLSITSVVYTPTDNPDGFKNRPVLSGVTPTANMAGDFVVALTPIPDGEIGPAVVSGVTVAQLNVISADHEYADTATGVDATLRTYDTGRAQIIWKESGTGSKWAAVRLGIEPPTGLWGKAAAIWQNDATPTGNGCYVNVNPCKRDGTGVDSGVTHKVWLPRNGRREDPNVQADDVISYQREPGGDFVNPSGCLDGKVNETVRIHLDASNVPAGWGIVDKGKFYVGYDDGDSDYDAVGKTGGAKTHTHGGHADHADHNHVLGPNGPLPGGGSYATPTTGGVVGGDAGNTLKHDAHSSSDHRPPFITRVWIKRTS